MDPGETATAGGADPCAPPGARRAPEPEPAERPLEPSAFELLARLERRLGPVHARQRFGIEQDREGHPFGEGPHVLHVENWRRAHGVIRTTLRLSGLYRRGRRNAERLEIHRNTVALAKLPARFDGFTILHLSDLHVDISAGAMHRLEIALGEIDYDLCVLTGDYRGRTFGPFAATLRGLERLRRRLTGPVYGVLGNHDTILMVPGMEDIGIAMLLNEAVILTRGEERLYLAGIDDAHYYRVDNIEKAAAPIPPEDCAILLSHTPEIFRQAAHAGFDLMLAGHTHGGQICLPGRIPVTLDAALPRQMGAGPWRYREMVGYTSKGVGSSIVPVRLNCLPEITLHRLHRAAPARHNRQ